MSDNKAITLENLSLYQEHLFVLSACKEGIIERLLLKTMHNWHKYSLVLPFLGIGYLGKCIWWVGIVTLHIVTI